MGGTRDTVGGLERAGADEACPGSEGRARGHGGDDGGRRGVGGGPAAEEALVDARRKAAVGTELAAVGDEGLPRRTDGVQDSVAAATRLGRGVYSTMRQQQES